jgi:hypothetical protein
MAGTPPPGGSTTTAATTFSLYPGNTSVNAFDWTNTNDLKIHKMVVDKLTHGFDMQPSGMRNFLKEVETRSDEVGFSTLFDIDVTRASATGVVTTIKRNLLRQYGQLTLEVVQLSTGTYLATDSRKAQLEAMLYTCLSKSLTANTQKRMSLNTAEFEANGRKSGTCYLKVIMMETQQDTNATTKHLRDNLRALDEYIVKIDSDIIKFNEYVKEQMEGLAARGETTQDLLTNLFRAYKSVSDKEFIRYIKDRETAYEDGTDITSNELMTKARNRYKTMLQNGEWNSPTEDEAKIIALQAEMKSFRRGTGKPSDKTPKEGEYRKKRNDNRPAWHFEKPKENDPKSKTIDAKQYWWCPTHEAWVRHKPEECKGRGYHPNKEANLATAEGDAGKDAEKSPALKMSEALANMAIIEDPEDE